MNRILIKTAICVGIICFLLTGCAAKQNKKTLTAAEEARYAAAIEREDVNQPPIIEDGEVVIVNATGNVSESVLAEEIAEPQPVVPARDFHVARSVYDDFFAQSPALILARFNLEPIQDGTALLGYRIKSLRTPMPGVDIQPDDIIVGIDGVMPKNPDDYFKRWETCKAANACTVNIQRGVDRFALTWTADE